MTEDDVGKLCDDFAIKTGWTVQRLEQRRASRIAEGLPDRRYVIKGLARVWVELKAPNGRLTQDQYQFICDELATGGLAVCIDDVQVFAKLMQDARRGSSSINSALRDRMKELTDLVALRGFRYKKDGKIKL